MCGVDDTVGDGETLFAYRAFFERLESDAPIDHYKVCLLPEGKPGMTWVAAEEGCMDLLIGRLAPFDLAEAERHADYFRRLIPQLGTEIRRGGQFVQIPVRHPLPVMVCDGYAAIGDSAFMTMPVIGSGIANSFKAAAMLAKAVLRDSDGAFSAETLWPYQAEYYKKLGAGFAVLACIKKLLLTVSTEELDYVFEKGILTAAELTIGAESTALGDMFKLSIPDMIARAKSVCENKDLLKKLLPMFLQAGKIMAVCAAMPRSWNRKRVFRWADTYRKMYR